MSNDRPQIPDSAKRCSDAIRLHIAAGNAGKFAAIRMSDGGSDGVAYDTWSDAVAHQLHQTQCAYVKIPVDDMPPEHAARFLAWHRSIYDQGYRTIDPDDTRRPIMPYTLDAMRRQLSVAALRASLRGDR